MRIGVISDTHGYLHPGVFSSFRGVDMILHAGDIGNMHIIHELGRIAPVEAVFGNTDPGIVRDLTEEERLIEVVGHKIGICHGAGPYHNIIERLYNRFNPQGADIVIFGHTHESTEKQVNGIFFFNPGYGRKSAGILEMDEMGGYSTRILRL